MVANETRAAFMSKEDAIRDREIFVENLGDLLTQTRERIAGCILIDAEKPTEHVLVLFKGTGTQRIGTYMDSYAAIVKDVMKGIS